MAVKWETVKEGDVLWDKRRTKMGNTTMSRDSVYRVIVKSIDHAANCATASWNNNPPKRYWRKGIERLYRNQPQTKTSLFDRALSGLRKDPS